jgi:hypothetical protein
MTGPCDKPEGHWRKTFDGLMLGSSLPAAVDTLADGPVLLTASAGVIGSIRARSGLGSVWIQPADQEVSMHVFIGLEVSLAKTEIYIVDRDGVAQCQGEVPSEPGPLIERLAEWSGAIGLAGTEACPLSTGLREAGLPMGCVETRHAQRFLARRSAPGTLSRFPVKRRLALDDARSGSW